MKTEVKKLDGTKRELNVEISGDIVKSRFEDVFKRIGKEAKVKGFRPGHIPRDILEKEFSQVAHEQVLKELVPDVYSQAIQKEGLEAIDLPQIADVKLDRVSLSFKAHVEVGPEIPVEGYRGIKVKYEKVLVTPEEIKRGLDSLKEIRKADKIDDNFARGLGYPNLAELEITIERQLFVQKENLSRQKIENELIEDIMKDLDFKLPQALVNRQLEDLIRQAKVDLALKGLSREKIDEQEKELQKHLEPQAKQQVKVYLVLAAIAKKENIPADEQMPRRVMELLLKEANWQNGGG